MAGISQASDAMELPSQLAILPLRNRVLLPGAMVRIRCTSPSSVRLIEQELWQNEEAGVIGVVPTRDPQPDGSVGSSLLQLPSSLGGAGGGNGPVNSNGLEELEGVLGKGGGSSSVVDSIRTQRMDWHDKGVAAQALHLSRGLEKPGGTVTYTVVLEGRCRFSVKEMTARGPYLVANVSQLDMTKAENEMLVHYPEVVMAAKQFKAIAQEFLSILEQKRGMVGRTRALTQNVPAHRLADLLVATLDGSFEGRLAMLDAVDLKQRLVRATDLVTGHLQSIRVSESIHKKLEDKLSKTQRDFLLRQQMKVIKEELGDNEEEDDDVAGLQRKMEAAGMPPNVWKHAQRELRRLRKMSPQQPGYGSSRQYLELLTDLPWATSSEEKEINLDAARDALDKEHFGLKKVKRRIIEYLAVRKLKPDVRGPVLCFIGPPGVGKTSLGSSIAKALGRKFVRISLGGVKDEADIRGHRRTYIGSLPGRLIEGIKRAGVNNPVMLLDEIDKTGMDARGDPAAALLEVLDPEQNQAFNDHYLSVPFDLSKVVFVATANRSSPIPPALLDRMEMIEIPGYTPEEKRRIAMQHLIPRALEQHGISPWQLQIPEEAVEILISHYTREAGVRDLDRHLAALCRAEAVRVAEARTRIQQMEKDIQPSTAALMQGVVGGMGGAGDMEVEVEAAAMASGLQVGRNTAATVSIDIEPVLVNEALLEIVLGPPKFDGKEAAERVSTPGVAVGLVWTAVGGEVQFVEATMMSGKGDLKLTGQLGDVIKESAQIALTWVRARVVELSLMMGSRDNLMDGRDVHIHFPAGAVPKDGPSAGVTLVTALVSLLSKQSARADTAMTGEVTLRGLVLPVGGVKEKVLAAHRYGIKRVILPHRNLKDLQDVPAEIVAQMEVLPVKNVEEVLHHAFEGGCPVPPRSKL